jgi:hypothetical protein
MELIELKDVENKNGNVNCLHNVGGEPTHTTLIFVDLLYVGTTDGNVTLYKISKEVSMETGDVIRVSNIF